MVVQKSTEHDYQYRDMSRRKEFKVSKGSGIASIS